MSIAADMVRHVAGLARLEFDENEGERLGQELTTILEYFARIGDVETEGIEPTSHVVSVSSVLRGDTQRQIRGIGEGLVAGAHDSAAPFYRVPRFRQGRQ